MEHAAPGATRPAWCFRLAAEPESRPRTLKLSVFLADCVTPFQGPQRLTKGCLKECPERRLGPDQASINRPASKAVPGLLPVTTRNPKSHLFVLFIPLAPSGFATHCLSEEFQMSPAQDFLTPLDWRQAPPLCRAVCNNCHQLPHARCSPTGVNCFLSAFLWKPLCSPLLSAPFYTSGNRSSER